MKHRTPKRDLAAAINAMSRAIEKNDGEAFDVATLKFEEARWRYRGRAAQTSTDATPSEKADFSVTLAVAYVVFLAFSAVGAAWWAINLGTPQSTAICGGFLVAMSAVGKVVEKTDRIPKRVVQTVDAIATGMGFVGAAIVFAALVLKTV